MDFSPLDVLRDQALCRRIVSLRGCSPIIPVIQIKSSTLDLAKLAIDYGEHAQKDYEIAFNQNTPNSSYERNGLGYVINPPRIDVDSPINAFTATSPLYFTPHIVGHLKQFNNRHMRYILETYIMPLSDSPSPVNLEEKVRVQNETGKLVQKSYEQLFNWLEQGASSIGANDLVEFMYANGYTHEEVRVTMFIFNVSGLMDRNLHIAQVQLPKDQRIDSFSKYLIKAGEALQAGISAYRYSHVLDETLDRVRMPIKFIIANASGHFVIADGDTERGLKALYHDFITGRWRLFPTENTDYLVSAGVSLVPRKSEKRGNVFKLDPTKTKTAPNPSVVAQAAAVAA